MSYVLPLRSSDSPSAAADMRCSAVRIQLPAHACSAVTFSGQESQRLKLIGVAGSVGEPYAQQLARQAIAQADGCARELAEHSDMPRRITVCDKSTPECSTQVVNRLCDSLAELAWIVERNDRIGVQSLQQIEGFPTTNLVSEVRSCWRRRIARSKSGRITIGKPDCTRHGSKDDQVRFTQPPIRRYLDRESEDDDLEEGPLNRWRSDQSVILAVVGVTVRAGIASLFANAYPTGSLTHYRPHARLRP